MKKLTLLLAFIATATLCQSQIFGKEEKEERARFAKLKVKSCTMYQADYKMFYGKLQLMSERKLEKTTLSKAGDMIEDISYNERGTIESWIKMGSDKKGNNAFAARCNPDGTIDAKVTFKNVYDSLGRIITTNCFQYDTVFLTQSTYSYDSLGYMDVMKSYKYYNRLILDSYEWHYYDNQGRTIKIEFYDNTGNYKTRKEKKYDASGRLAELISYYISVYKYLPNGLTTEHTDYGENNKPVAKYRYVYEFYQ